MTIDDLYWMFSTIAQTLGAIVGLIGMVTVYKFQQIENFKRDIMERSFRSRLSVFGKKAYDQSTGELVKATFEMFGDVITDLGDFDKAIVVSATQIIKKTVDSTKRLRFRFLLFLIPNLLFIILNILAIPYSQKLVQWDIILHQTIGAFLIVVSFGFTVYLCSSLIGSKSYV